MLFDYRNSQGYLYAFVLCSLYLYTQLVLRDIGKKVVGTMFKKI